LKNDEAKNSYESLIYEFRGWLNEDGNEVYVDEGQQEKDLEKLAVAEEWLEDEGSEAGYKEYQTRHYNLSSDYNKYKNRQEGFKEREQLVPSIFEGLAKWKNEIDDLTESKPWITEDEKTDVLSKISEMNTWLAEKVDEQAGRKLSEDAVFTAKEVESKFKPLDKLYKKVTNKKKPKEKKPKKEKKEEKKCEDEEFEYSKKDEKKGEDEEFDGRYSKTEKEEEPESAEDESKKEEQNNEEENKEEENKDENFKTEQL